MQAANDLRRCLETCDVDGAVSVWRKVNPHLPVPSDPLAALHMARTSSESIPLKLRAYSHKWLIERGLPSLLPDKLRQPAERLYPVVAQTVGISVNYTNKIFAPVAELVRGSMEYAVLETFGDGERDPSVVKARMMEAKNRTLKKLVGAAVHKE